LIAELQGSLTYDEPPAWFYPIRESLGAAMLLSGCGGRGGGVSGRAAAKSPQRTDSVRVARVAEQDGWVKCEFDRAWEGADIKLNLRGM
jgi:hypothetical protein